jgi:site-specific DNA-cytosine methylase
VIENVPGIQSSRLGGGRLVDTIVCRPESLGYDVTACKLLATDYLVPQRSRRLFRLAMREASVSPPDPRTFSLRRLKVDAATAPSAGLCEPSPF